MKRSQTTIFSIVVVLLSAIGVWHFASNRTLETIRSQLEQTAFLAARSVETEIKRFRYLPTIAGEDERVRALLRDPLVPDRIMAANRYLATVANASGASFLYVLNSEGLTLAASNWDQPDTLVGNNYGFRPYFKNAMEEMDGRYYAIGVTTGKPGYFLARRIDPGEGGKAGVVVVKIDLLPLEASWTSAAQNISLADRNGIVFLSGNRDWKYRPVVPLSQATIRQLIDTRTYEGVDLESQRPIVEGKYIDGFLAPDDTAFARVNTELISVSKRLPEEGWTLHATSNLAPVAGNATTWSLITVLVGVLLSGALHFVLQRRQLVALRLRQNELLERKVEERTRDLAHEIDVRKAAEQDLKLAQDGLVHAEKMAALGRMSAAIVHEVSQPLAALETTLASTSLLAKSGQEKGVSKRIETARNLVRRMQRTVKHLKTFSRKDNADIEVFDCVTSIREALELARPRAEKVGVKPQVRADKPVFITGSAIRLEQVFLNLLLNALDALDGTADPQIIVQVKSLDTQVEIEVQDNGHGITAENLNQVTEPFFTTKAVSEGLGLGLSISATIIEEHGGELELEPNSLGGITARIRMPLQASMARAAE